MWLLENINLLTWLTLYFSWAVLLPEITSELFLSRGE